MRNNNNENRLIVKDLKTFRKLNSLINNTNNLNRGKKKQSEIPSK